MLVLTRKQGEAICLGDGTEVTVLGVGKTRVKLGVTCPRDVSIRRPEADQKRAQRELAAADRA